MTIKLKHELIFNNFKTVNGRGANVHVKKETRNFSLIECLQNEKLTTNN